MMAASYSIIVPVCHGGRFLENALLSLQQLIDPPGGFEVVLAGNREAAEVIFNRNAGASWTFIDSRGSRSESLNAACEIACGAIWVFSDDDCVYPPDWLLRIDDFFSRHPEAAVLGGADVLAKGSTSFDMALDAVLSAWLASGGTRSDWSLKAGAYYPKLWNMAVRADTARHSALEGQSGRLIFDANLPVHEDVDLIDRVRRVGAGSVLYAPEIKVLHSRNTTYADFFKRNLAMARTCRLRSIHVWPHRFLAAMLAGLLALGLLSIWSSCARWVVSVGLGIYLFMLFVTAACAVRKKKKAAMLLWVPVLLVTLHLGRALGYVVPLGNAKEKIL